MTNPDFLAGLDLILTHFDGPTWPRTIMTAKTRGQVTVNSKEEALRLFEEADYVDCRISAYHKAEYCSSCRDFAVWPDMIFVDLDSKLFKTPRAFRLALGRTLTTTKNRLGGFPTVIWSGNGYHVLQPTTIFPYNGHAAFDRFEDVAPDLNSSWMRFCAMTLSSGKHDPDNTQSLRNTMLRIPGSFNGKCIANGKDPTVKVIQQWDGKRPDIKLLLGDFISYLTSQKIQRIEAREKFKPSPVAYSSDGIFWIERLLSMPIPDSRKNTIRLVLAPYLVTIKNMDVEQAYSIIKHWLNLCDSVKRLERGFYYDIYTKSCLKKAKEIGLKPVSLANLEQKNKTLYDLLMMQIT